MSSPAAVWKCLDTDRVHQYLEQREKERADFDAGMDAFRATVGGNELFGIHGIDGSICITGYELGPREEPLPGWRRDGAAARAVPAARTIEGKQIAAELRNLQLSSEIYPGTPRFMRSETDKQTGRGYLMSPVAEELGGTYYLSLSHEPRSSDADSIDPKLWKRIRLSEYHAALEAQADSNAEAAAA